MKFKVGDYIFFYLGDEHERIIGIDIEKDTVYFEDRIHSLSFVENLYTLDNSLTRKMKIMKLFENEII